MPDSVRRATPVTPAEFAVVGNLTNGTQMIFRRGIHSRPDAEAIARGFRRCLSVYTSVPVLSVDIWLMRARALARPTPPVQFSGIE